MVTFHCDGHDMYPIRGSTKARGAMHSAGTRQICHGFAPPALLNRVVVNLPQFNNISVTLHLLVVTTSLKSGGKLKCK